MHTLYLKRAGLALALALAATSVHAADRTVMLPIAVAMDSADARAKLDESVKFYFGDQAAPGKQVALGSSHTSQKTNAFGKADATACNWAFLSSMLQLHRHAQKVGANAVINIRSNYNNQEMSSSSQFECHAGAVMAGVALKADFVKIGQ